MWSRKSIKMGQCILGIWFMAREKASMECKSGMTGLNMKESGKTIRLREKENSFIQMVISMKDNGLSIKQMVREYTDILTEQFTKEIGKKICKTEEDWKLGVTDLHTKENTLKERNTEWVRTNGMMGLHILGFGMIIK